MNRRQSWKWFGTGMMALVCLGARAQMTYQDDFSKTHDYIASGVAGTIWDGVYLGAGEIMNPMGTWVAPGSVSLATASNGVLHIASLQTDWENDSDDGVFLFKVITGDFDMSVEVVGPINHSAHNFPGLMVRAFGLSGEPAPNSKENYFLLGRFDEYNIPNMLKSIVNGVKKDTKLGTWPNTNNWLRIQRAGNVFTLSEKATAAENWNPVGSVTREDFAGRALQVGIEHADFDGGRTLPAAYKNFSLTVSNMGPFAAPPPQPLGARVVVMDGSNTEYRVIWQPAPGSSGCLVTIWQGSAVVKEAPANGMNYRGDGDFGHGEPLPGRSVYVLSKDSPVMAGLFHIPPGTPAHVGLFSFTGSGKTLSYSHDPVVLDVPLPK